MELNSFQVIMNHLGKERSQDPIKVNIFFKEDIFYTGVTIQLLDTFSQVIEIKDNPEDQEPAYHELRNVNYIQLSS